MVSFFVCSSILTSLVLTFRVALTGTIHWTSLSLSLSLYPREAQILLNAKYTRKNLYREFHSTLTFIRNCVWRTCRFRIHVKRTQGVVYRWLTFMYQTHIRHLWPFVVLLRFTHNFNQRKTLSLFNILFISFNLHIRFEFF